MARQIKRTKKGRFAKGSGGGPGRKKKKEIMGVPIAQARQVFEKVFTAVFNKSGDWKELVAFVEKNQLNQRLFLQEYRKLIPEDDGKPAEEERFTVNINRIITNDVEKIPLTQRGDRGETEKKDEPIGRPKKKPDPPGPEDMTNEQLKAGIEELEKKKEGLMVALAEKRPNKSKAVN